MNYTSYLTIKIELVSCYSYGVKQLIIFGLSDFADIAYEYFTHDSDFEVVAFTVDEDYLTNNFHLTLPVIPFESIENYFKCEEVYIFVAIVYGNLNKVREEKLLAAKTKGLLPASYLSSRAFIWKNVELGEHNFIFEDNVIQPYVTIGNNNVIWSSNHIGHHSKIGNSNFLASEIGMSGWVTLEDNCFIGTGTTISNGVSIGSNTWVSEGSIISRQVQKKSFIASQPSEVFELELDRLEMKLRKKSSDRLKS